MTRLRFPSALRRQFRAHAIKCYPNEAYAVLLGFRHGESVEVRELHLPEVWSTPSMVNYAVALADAKADADAEHLQVIGDIHTHPGFDEAEPSAADLAAATKGLIWGICAIRKNGNRFRTKTKFWGLVERVDVT